MKKLKDILEREIAQRELALKHNPLNKDEIKEELTELQQGLVKLFAIPVKRTFCQCKKPLIEGVELHEDVFVCLRCGEQAK